MSCFVNGERVSGNLGIRTVPLIRKGDVLPAHRHDYDHTVIVLTGSVRIELTAPDGVVTALDLIAAPPGNRLATGYHCLVPAGALHKSTALVDDTLFLCVRARPEPR